MIRALTILLSLVTVAVSAHAQGDVEVTTLAREDLLLVSLELPGAGRFRDDLFYRLNVVPIIVPPLRDRREDVGRLSEHFLSIYAGEYGHGLKRFDPEALAVLRHYDWPGNVRELRNVIERVVIMVPGPVVTAQDLSFLKVSTLATNGPAAHTTVAVRLHEARDQFERDYILSAFAAQRGNISRAADALGLERSHLYRKMRTFGIRPSRPGGPHRSAVSGEADSPGTDSS